MRHFVGLTVPKGQIMPTKLECDRLFDSICRASGESNN
eukprot:SAG31_NODE_44639_length_262_cov_0.625767_1_plen_37_part_01